MIPYLFASIQRFASGLARLDVRSNFRLSRVDTAPAPTLELRDPRDDTSAGMIFEEYRMERKNHSGN